MTTAMTQPAVGKRKTGRGPKGRAQIRRARLALEKERRAVTTGRESR